VIQVDKIISISKAKYVKAKLSLTCHFWRKKTCLVSWPQLAGIWNGPTFRQKPLPKGLDLWVVQWDKLRQEIVVVAQPHKALYLLQTWTYTRNNLPSHPTSATIYGSSIGNNTKSFSLPQYCGTILRTALDYSRKPGTNRTKHLC